MATFSHYLHEKMNQYSDSIAIKVNNEQITYEEFLQKSLKVSSALNRIKTNPAETIGIIGQRNLSSFLGVVGTLFSGSNYTPINSKQSDELILSIIEQSEIKILITDDEDTDFIIN